MGRVELRVLLLCCHLPHLGPYVNLNIFKIIKNTQNMFVDVNGIKYLALRDVEKTQYWENNNFNQTKRK